MKSRREDISSFLCRIRRCEALPPFLAPFPPSTNWKCILPSESSFRGRERPVRREEGALARVNPPSFFSLERRKVYLHMYICPGNINLAVSIHEHKWTASLLVIWASALTPFPRRHLRKFPPTSYSLAVIILPLSEKLGSFRRSFVYLPMIASAAPRHFRW